MANNVQIFDARSAAGAQAIYGGVRPRAFVGNDRIGQITTARGTVVNSLLRKDEWERLDQAVVRAAVPRLNAVSHLVERGLTLGLNIGTIISEWNESSEFTAANVSITGQSRGEADAVEFDLAAVPVPVIFKEYSIPMRMLMAARNAGNALDTTAAFNAGQVVAEKLEDMLLNGNALTFNGRAIYGYTTHPSRNTDTATNYGGGDFGTSDNGRKTVLGMKNAANADRFYGPFIVYVYTTQYNQLLQRYTDGSGQTELDAILAIPTIEAVYPSDWLDDGEVVMVQVTPNVVDIAIAQTVTNMEWADGNGMTGNFRVQTIAVPRVKADYNARCGIVHATGA